MDAWDFHRWVYSGEMQNLLNLLTFTAWCKESMIRIVFGKVFHLFKRAQQNKYNLMKLLCIFICSDVNLVNLAFLKFKKTKMQQNVSKFIFFLFEEL